MRLFGKWSTDEKRAIFVSSYVMWIIAGQTFVCALGKSWRARARCALIRHVLGIGRQHKLTSGLTITTSTYSNSLISSITCAPKKRPSTTQQEVCPCLRQPCRRLCGGKRTVELKTAEQSLPEILCILPGLQHILPHALDYLSVELRRRRESAVLQA